MTTRKVTDNDQAIRDGGPRTTHDRSIAGTRLPRLARTVRKAEVDERVGGRLSIWHADGAGNDVGGSESEIVELVPGERIVLHWQFVGPDRTTDPAMATRLTVTFTPTPDGTQLDLTHDLLDGLRDRYPHIAEQVGPGWESALDALVAVGW